MIYGFMDLWIYGFMKRFANPFLQKETGLG